jgi:hypothetical protein
LANAKEDLKMRLSNWLLAAVLSGLLLGTSSCASILGKSQYPVTITSQPDRANITIVDDEGKQVYSGTTPTTVTLATKAGYFKGRHYTVTFSKDGYEKHTAEIRRGVSNWYIFGNMVFGGLIGWLIVDPATGAMWTLEEHLDVNLSPLKAAAAGDGTLRIASIDDVPAALRPMMRHIE